MSSLSLEITNTVKGSRKAPRGELTTSITAVENGDGSITFSISVSGPKNFTGDIRGFFFDVPENSLLSGLQVTGEDVNSTLSSQIVFTALAGGRMFRMPLSGIWAILTPV